MENKESLDSLLELCRKHNLKGAVLLIEVLQRPENRDIVYISSTTVGADRVSVNGKSESETRHIIFNVLKTFGLGARDGSVSPVENVCKLIQKIIGNGRDKNLAYLDKILNDFAIGIMGKNNYVTFLSMNILRSKK